MRSLAAAMLGVASMVAACAGSTEPDVTITRVSPGEAYDQEEQMSLVIDGGPFRPVYAIDTSEGRASMELGSFTGFITPQGGTGDPRPFEELLWVSSSELLARLPKSVPAGLYDVFVRDPRGRVARLEGGFRSLGDDTDPPVVTVIQPPNSTIVIGGSQVPVAVLVSDAPGRLKSIVFKAATGDGTSTTGFCPVGPMTSEAMCRFTFPTSEPALPGQPLTVSIEALDSEGNKGIGTVTLALSVAPTVTKVEPLEGPAYGGTELTVTGTNFVPGTELLIDGVVAPLVPNGLENGVVLRARTPPHEPGFVDVTVRAGSATVEAPSKFRYVGQPVVLAVAPSQGPVTGGTRVAIVGKNFREGATRIFFGTFDGMDLTELVCPKFVGASRFEGFTPPGMGASSIFVFDPIGGQSDLRTAFTYLDVDTPAAVPPGPPPCREGPP